MQPPNPDLEAILLAAGRSRRMAGVNKLLLAADGQPMIRRSARLYLDLGLPLTLVTGSDNHAILDTLAGLEFKLVVNASADDGQHTSVRAGLSAALLNAPGVLIALADQPLLTSDDILALAAEFFRHGGRQICVPRNAGKRGNPVIFPTVVARGLRAAEALSPRAYIDTHESEVAWFDADSDHFTRDVDTPADVAKLLGARDRQSLVAKRDRIME